MSYPAKKKFVQKDLPAEQGTFSSRVPPQSVEAEESVLGGVMLDNEAINTAIELINADDFYRASHRAIYRGMIELLDKREPIDIVTLSQQLREMGALDEAGGIENLSRLAGSVPSAANVGYYSKVVKQLAVRRRIIHEASAIISDAFDNTGDVEQFLDSVENRILKVSDYRISPTFSKVGDIVKESIKHVESLYDRKELVTGTPSGYSDLDRITAGFQPSDLVIIAARPSMGKTALALGIAQHAAIDKNRPVALFSLEMSKHQLVLRMLCSEARVDGSKVRTGHLGERDFPRLVEAASRIAEAPLFIDDTPALTITEVRAKARRLHRESPLSLIVVDYLQLLRSPSYSDAREQEIADISRSLKALAKELSVPVIALSQLNRSVESRTDKRPLLSDLRESGAIEQDADVIMFIYRDEFYNRDSNEKGVAEVLISKQRNGPTGMIKLAFASECTRFDTLAGEREAEPESQDNGFVLPDVEEEPF